MSNIQITELYIYPVKSLRGIAITSGMVTPRGFRHDRRWMIVDEEGRFITQRQESSLALVEVAIEEESLRLTAPGMSPLHLPLEPEEGRPREVTVWSDRVEAWSVSEEADGWISEYLGRRAAIVYMPESTQRTVDPEYATSSGDIVSFADGMPFLLISEGSLADLNRRLIDQGASKMTMNRFRPNIVVSGCPAYQEDRWRLFRINGLRLSGVKPCSRCVVTTIDPSTGKKGQEPLRTLSDYRRQGNKVFFGENVIPCLDDLVAEPRWLRVGDTVEIVELKEQESETTMLETGIPEVL